MRLKSRNILGLILGASWAADVTINIGDKLKKQVGDSTVLLCDVTYSADETLPEDTTNSQTWTTTSGKALKPVTRVISKSKKVQSTLYMTKLTADDAGTYTCDFNGQSKSVELTVFDRITFADSPDGAPVDKAIVVGKVTSLVCAATPAGLNYNWFGPDGTTIAGDTLDTSSFDASAEGAYTCNADNADGKAKNLPVDSLAQLVYNVAIAYPPKVTVTPTAEVVVLAGAAPDTTFTCNSDAKPAGDYKWLKSGEVIEDATTSELSIDTIEYSNNGQVVFTCKSTNEHGSASADVSVRVIKLPTVTITEKVEGQSFSKTEPESLQLTCKGDGDPTPDKFTWTLPDGSTSDGAKLKIDAVDDTHHGQYQCSASSSYNGTDYGPGTATIDVDVKYKPRFKADSTVYAVRGKDQKVACTFKANPKPTVTWIGTSLESTTEELDDYQITSSVVVPAIQNFTKFTCSGKNDIDTSQQGLFASVPGKVGDFNQSNADFKQVTLSWTKPESVGIPILSYLVKYRQTGTEKYFETTITGQDDGQEPPTQVVINDNLSSGATYEFFIIAENAAGKSEQSDTLLVDTKKPEPPRLEITKKDLKDGNVEIKWTVIFAGSNAIEKVIVEYGKVDKNGNKQTDKKRKEIKVEDAKKGDKVPLQTLDLEPGVEYWAMISVVNDGGFESDKKSVQFLMPDKITKGSAGTVISVMVGIIFILILFVDISCYYMKQGGFIMTIQRALCSGGNNKEEIGKDNGEKVPLNQEADGSIDDKDKNGDTDK